MINKWYGLRGPITAAMAEAEPEHIRLFGSAFEARRRKPEARQQDSRINKAKYRPWRKPEIIRPATAPAGKDTSI